MQLVQLAMDRRAREREQASLAISALAAAGLQETQLTFAFEEGSAKAFVCQGSSELERICLALDRQKDSADCWVMSYRVRWRAIQNK